MASEFERAQDFYESMNWEGLEQWEKDAIWANYWQDELNDELDREYESTLQEQREATNA